jgi:hypothetical protein
LVDWTRQHGDPNRDCTARLELYFPAIEADTGGDPSAMANLSPGRPRNLTTPIRLTLLISAPTTDPITRLQDTARLGLQRAFPTDRGAADCRT